MNPFISQRWLGYLPLFDPEFGTTVAEPEGAGAGWWAGAPSVTYDIDTQTWWLYYRLRYMDALAHGGHLWCYYEYARADGSHELRLSRVPWPDPRT